MDHQPPLFNPTEVKFDTHWSEGPLVGFDVETTSPNPLDARIVSWSLLGVGFDQHVIIQPDGYEIPAEAASVHGITTERALAEGIPPHLARMILLTSFESIIEMKAPVVVYNAPYDLTILWMLLPELDLDSLLVLDPLVIDKQFDRYRKGSRKLGDVAAHHGVILGDDAHDARADVIASVGLMRALARKHELLRQHSITGLQQQQRLWYATQAESFERYLREKKGEKDAVINRDWPIRKDTPNAQAQ